MLPAKVAIVPASLLLLLLPLSILGERLASGRTEEEDLYEPLRVSTSVFQEHVNHHKIGLGDGGAIAPPSDQQQQQQVRKTTTVAGKPAAMAVVLPPATQQQQQQQQQQPPTKKKYANPGRPAHQASPLAPAAAASRPAGVGNGAQSQQQQQQQPSAHHSRPSRSSFRLKLTPYGTCKWMTLREFKNISLDTSELIIRDADEQPCYILTMQAHLKWTDDDYFPLSNLRSLPHANKVSYEGLSEPASGGGGGGAANMALNCSLAAAAAAANLAGGGPSATTSLFLPMLNRPFREEITLVGDCGYLVLRTQANGSYLNVEALSYYQNSDVPIQTPAVQHQQQRPPAATSRININSPAQSEFLVFSTEGTYSPLITIPLISRYICQNRIVLTGKNNVQLVLDRFELQRLSYPLLEIGQLVQESPGETVHHPDRLVEPLQQERQQQQQLHRVARDLAALAAPRRSPFAVGE